MRCHYLSLEGNHVYGGRFRRTGCHCSKYTAGRRGRKAVITFVCLDSSGHLQRSSGRHEHKLARSRVRHHQVHIWYKCHSIRTLTRVHHRYQLSSRTELLQPAQSTTGYLLTQYKPPLINVIFKVVFACLQCFGIFFLSLHLLENYFQHFRTFKVNICNVSILYKTLLSSLSFKSKTCSVQGQRFYKPFITKMQVHNNDVP